MNPPMSRFRRFERVEVRGWHYLPDRTKGAIIWCDPPAIANSNWELVLELDAKLGIRFPTVPESHLRSLGDYSAPERHLGARDEISFDVASGREGCLRRRGTFWECYFFDDAPVERVTLRTAPWRSGITGHLLLYPRQIELHPVFVLESISRLLAMDPILVRGPNSCSLK